MRNAVLLEWDTLAAIKVIAYCLGKLDSSTGAFDKAGGRMWLLRAQFHLAPDKLNEPQQEGWVM